MAVDMSRVKVLIVDDNGYMLTILRTILHGFGIKQILESKDPADAFDMVRSDSVDIIITDYQLLSNKITNNNNQKSNQINA